jgi:Acyclic terpene utilisation family protein AtuA
MGLEYLSFFVGAGFPDDSVTAARDLDLTFVGADAGTIDVGPYQLAGSGTIFSGPLCRHDLKRSLLIARAKRIPLVIGSCGGAGRDAGVDWFAAMLREIAREAGLEQFKLARIYSEVDREYLRAKIKHGRLRPLAGLQLPYTEEHVSRSTRIAGVMGAEPFIAALQEGADVVLAGRATDSAIFSAIPLQRGYPESVSWHAAKVAECGGAIGEPARPDLLRVTLDQQGFVVTTLSAGSRCTPWSVSAHQLYENADPTRFVEPSGTINTANVVYTASDDRSVRITGATFEPADGYTMKLEGVEPAGYQSIAMASYNDSVLLEELPAWLERTKKEISAKLRRVLGAAADTATLTIRTYGAGNGSDLFNLRPVGVPGADAFFLMDAVAPTQELATSVATVAWHTLIHFPPTGWRGGVITAAWPFNPPVLERGLMHRFNVNHVIELDNRLEGVRIEYEAVG